MHPTWVALHEMTCKLVQGYMHGVHRMCSETATVSHGTSAVSTKQRCKYTTSMDLQKRAVKGYNQFVSDKSAVSLHESR